MEPTALYLRASSRDQIRNGVSIPDQLTRLRAASMAAGETIVAEFIDQARSGTNAAKRKEYQRLLAAARRREFVRVRVESVDRGHRNDLERREFEAEMQSLGIRVIYCGESDRQAPQYRKFNRGIRGVVAELESDETSDRTYKRHLYRAQQGKWRGGNVPYGLQPDGQGWFVPDTATYSALRWILERRAEGLGYHRIAKLLNTGVSLDGAPPTIPPTPGMRRYQRRPYREWQDPETGEVLHLERPIPDPCWKVQAVRRICQAAIDSVYAGILRWGATANRFSEYDADGRPKQLVRVDTGRPLVESNLLQRVQAIEWAAQSGQVQPAPHNHFLLTHLLHCGHCGRAMTGYTSSKYTNGVCYKYRKYRCAGRANRPGACAMTILGANPIEQIVVAAVLEAAAPARLLTALTTAVTRRRGELLAALDLITARTKMLEQQRDNALDLLIQNRQLSEIVQQTVSERIEAISQEVVATAEQQRSLLLGLEVLDTQARAIDHILRHPDLDSARWAEPNVNTALQRALQVIVRRIEVAKSAPRKYVIRIWLPDDEDVQFSEKGTFESAWELNPSAKLVTPPTRFEDEDSHRATSALARHSTLEKCGCQSTARW